MRRALGNLTSSDNPRAELDRLQRELETRQSVVHFAHAGVSFFATVILSAASVKLFWDSIRTPILGFIAAGLSLVLACYGTYRLVLGQRVSRRERERFEVLQSLRRNLNLDDPSALLPR